MGEDHNWPPSWGHHPGSGERKYDGACSDGLANGQGTLTIGVSSNDGLSYIGGWKDGMPSGHGVGQIGSAYYDAVHHYDGEWQNGLPHGRGTMITKTIEGAVFLSYSGTWDGGHAKKGELLEYYPNGKRASSSKGEFYQVDSIWDGTYERWFPDGRYHCDRYIGGGYAGTCVE